MSIASPREEPTEDVRSKLELSRLRTFMPDQTIRNLEDAESFFLSMGCSHFHMDREFPEQYAQYLSLRIPEETELKWRRKKFEATKGEMFGNHVRHELWWRYSDLSELARGLCARANDTAVLKELVDITERIAALLPDSTRLLVAETIVGRGSPPDYGGLITFAWSSGAPAEARSLAGLAYSLSQGSSAPEGGPPIEERRAG